MIFMPLSGCHTLRKVLGVLLVVCTAVCTDVLVLFLMLQRKNKVLEDGKNFFKVMLSYICFQADNCSEPV